MANEDAGLGSEQTGGCEGAGAEGLPGGAVVPCFCLPLFLMPSYCCMLSCGTALSPCRDAKPGQQWPALIGVKYWKGAGQDGTFLVS